MNESQKTLLKLISKSQFNNCDELDYPDSIEWNSIYDEAVNQTVIGSIISRIPDTVLHSDKKWINIQNYIIAENIRYYYAQDEITELLELAEIPYVIIKGAAVAVYYSQPFERMMGDIDILVLPSLYENAKALLREHNDIEESDDG